MGRKRAATPRSASSPPSLSCTSNRSTSRSKSKMRVEAGAKAEQEKTENNGVEAEKERSNGGGAGGGAARRGEGTITSSVAPTSSPASCASLRRIHTEYQADLPSEDFVEGGVELPPSDDGGRDTYQDIPPPRPTRPLPPWNELEEFWPNGNGQRALFLDYDGTLREFEARPEQATPTRELEELLEAINAREDLVPHIISGRDAKFLAQCFAKLNRFTLIAEHGFQIWRPGTEGFELTHHPDGLDQDHDDWKEIVRRELGVFVDMMPRSHIEEKASSLVWHYREVADQDRAEKVALDCMEQLEMKRDAMRIHKIRISHGHKVVEVSYRKVRKGPVMRRICEERAAFSDPFLSVFVAGDDVSDESMFDLAPHDFLTVKVGPGQTLAKFRVDSPAHLRGFLLQLLN